MAVVRPERRDTRAEVANVPSKGGKGKAFILGGLVVVALVTALVVWGGPFGTWQGDDADVEVSTQTEVPGAVEGGTEPVGAVGSEPAMNEVEMEQEAAPAAPAAPDPQN